MHTQYKGNSESTNEYKSSITIRDEIYCNDRHNQQNSTVHHTDDSSRTISLSRREARDRCINMFDLSQVRNGPSSDGKSFGRSRTKQRSLKYRISSSLISMSISCARWRDSENLMHRLCSRIFC